MKFKLLLILLFCSTGAFAQLQNQKGSLMLKSGDVLRGTITHYYDDPTVITFYSEEGAKQVFASHQVQEIKLSSGEKFVARPYAVDQDTTTLVLQALIESPKISLYTREDNGQRFFFASKDGVFYRLENSETMVEKDSKTFRKKDYKYIGTLNFLTSDRPDLFEKISKLKLNEQDLRDIVLSYNNGDVSYAWDLKSKTAKEPNWILFTQYSQFGSIHGSDVVSLSSGQMVGLQYYFSKHSRHSIKLSFDYSKLDLEQEDVEIKGLGIRYQGDLKTADKYNFYFILHLADIAYVTRTTRAWLPKDEQFELTPRVSPGLGLEVKPLSRLAVYGELNNIVHLQVFPRSFSLGLKYDFGKTRW